jgi:hypothetical protein
MVTIFFTLLILRNDKEKKPTGKKGFVLDKVVTGL